MLVTNLSRPSILDSKNGVMTTSISRYFIVLIFLIMYIKVFHHSSTSTCEDWSFARLVLCMINSANKFSF